MSTIIWVHADALSRRHPVFTAAPDDARAIYIWDADDLARRNWSLKRCIFVLECLADMNVELIQGHPVAVMAAMGAKQIFTAATPDPYRRDIITTLNPTITVVPNDPFVTVLAETDMGRFFRYWNKAKRSALRLTQSAHAKQD